MLIPLELFPYAFQIVYGPARMFVHSDLAFFLGDAGQLSEQWRFALITFSTYPAVRWCCSMVQSSSCDSP
jgi:hypothetical protein